MSDPARSLVRWSGVSLILGGACLAAFLLLHPYGMVAGAHTARTLNWLPAHSLHFVGALLTLFGLVGFYIRHMGALGRLGFGAFLVAFAGTAMFVGTGMITALMWPVIAEYSPDFVAADGPMFTQPLTRLAIDGTYTVLVIGYLLLGLSILRARMAPWQQAALLMVGIVTFSAPVTPVGPVPWIVRVIGAVVFGSALAWLGWSLRADPGEPATG
jgi:hypothetical protein